MRRSTLLALAALLWPAPGRAMGPVGIRADGRETAVVNALPVPVVALVVERDRDGNMKHFEVPVVPPEGAANVATGRSYQVELIEPVHPLVGRKAIDWACPAHAAAATVTLSQLRGELDALAVSGSREVERQMALETEIARIHVAQLLDERNTRRDDPVKWELETERLEYATMGDLQQYDRQRTAETIGDATAGMMFLAFIFSSGEDAKLRALQSDAERLQPLLQTARSSAQTLDRAAESYSREAEALLVFGSVYRDRLVRLPRYSPPALEPSSGVERPCAGAARVSDLISFSASTESPVTVTEGRATFNDGSAQPVMFRRVSGTDEWVGTVVWPRGADSGSVGVREPDGSWRMLKGTMAPGRPAFDARRAEVHKVADEIESRIHEAELRAGGADVLNTIVVP
jgi:hypothetical protein